MSFLLRLCLGLVILAPSLAHAQSALETPLNGDKLSGIGVIRGWKCDAGDITVRFDDDEMLTVPMVYGVELGYTSPSCGDTNNGFVAIYNWAILGDGEHTAVAYDNGVEFARSTFTVATAGEEYLADAPDTCVTVDDFPSAGETTYLEWNTSTQHFEMVESCTPSEPLDLGMCMVGLTVQPGQMCSGTLTTAIGEIDYTFTVNAEGAGCIDRTNLVDACYPAMLPDVVASLGVDVTRNDDGSWTINALPSS